MAQPNIDANIHVGIILDFETGNLKAQTAACTQISVLAVRLDTWEIFDKYTSYIKPYYRKDPDVKTKKKVLRNKRDLQLDLNIDAPQELMEYSEKALTYSGITMDMLYEKGKDIEEVAGDVISLIDRAALTKGRSTKPVLIGHNIPFDISFLQQLMFYGGKQKELEKVLAGSIDFFGNFQPKYIDTIELSKLAFANDPNVHSYKLEIVAEYAGVEIVDAHDAEADTVATRDLTMVLSNRMRSGTDGVGLSNETKHKTRMHFKI